MKRNDFMNKIFIDLELSKYRLNEIGKLERKTMTVLTTKKKVRVGFIAPSIHYGGAERWMLNLARYCDPTTISWTTCVITDHWHDYRMLSAMAALMPTYFNNLLFKKDVVIPHTLHASVEDLLHQSDVVIGWEFDKKMLELIDDRQTKVINVAHRNSTTLSEFTTNEQYFAAVSNSCRGAFGKEREKDVKVIPNGIDLNRCFPVKSRKEMRKSWGSTDEEIVIGFIGRMDPAKNCVALARAVKGLRHRGRGVFYGPKVLNVGQISRQMRNIGGNQIQLFEAVEDIGSILHAIDVFMLPSYTEALSLSLLEAWAMGVPVVTTKIGQIPELEDKFGQLIIPIEPDASEEELAHAILEAVENPGFQEIILRAQKMVLRSFNVTLMAKRWTEYIISVASNH